ncbi:hypothetical protein GCM10010517_64360 [Streptosporangium fragile]|uniref:Acyl-CoA carboxylase subunit epsilon n=1 Tax=Streptosporangium fragile TaxID=46186 RepID=A0ABN3W6I6_9ACTN
MSATGPAAEEVGPAVGGAAPALRVIKGAPSPEELAALVAALTVRTAGAAVPTPVPGRRRGWGAYRHALRPPLTGGWRESRWKLGGLQ